MCNKKWVLAFTTSILEFSTKANTKLWLSRPQEIGVATTCLFIWKAHLCMHSCIHLLDTLIHHPLTVRQWLWTKVGAKTDHQALSSSLRNWQFLKFGGLWENWWLENRVSENHRLCLVSQQLFWHKRHRNQQFRHPNLSLLKLNQMIS